METAAKLLILQRELGTRSLYQFLKICWPRIVPTPFVDGKHIRLVCDHLEALTEGLITNLVVNVPPGFTKSKTFQVFWPTWSWLHHPDLAFCFASIDPGIPMREAKASMDLMSSEWFQERWGDRFSVDPTQAVGEFWNSKGGLRFATSEGGAAIGYHFDVIGVDDPHKPQNLGLEALGKTSNWWSQTMASRAKNRATLRRAVVMQRLHEADLSAVCVEDGYEHLYLPMRYEPERKCITSVGEDWRTTPGELLCEARANAETVTKWEKDLGTASDGQLQQRPGRAGGSIFLEDWLKQRHELGRKVQGLVIQSWDFNFKDKDQVKPGRAPDWIVGSVWALIGSNFYLLHQVRGQWDFQGCLDQVRAVSALYPMAITKLVEAKANGPAIVSMLQDEIVGFELVEPMGDKPSRAHAVSGLFKSLQVFLPNADWVPEYVRELVAFPRGRNDDQVDTTTQALLWLAPKVGGDQKGANDALEELLRG